MTACGTRSGYQRHQDEDTPACPPCLAANSSAVKASRVRTGKTRSLYVDVDVLAQTLAAHPCDALLAFLGEEVAEAVMRAPKAIGEAA